MNRLDGLVEYHSSPDPYYSFLLSAWVIRLVIVYLVRLGIGFISALIALRHGL
jgi:hypothetical protein